MSKIQQNFAQYLKALQIMLFGLVFGAASMLVLFYFNPTEESGTMPEDGFVVYIPIVVLGLIVGAFYLGRNRVEAAREIADLKEKMLAYRAALILRWAMIEGASLMAGVFFFLSRNTQLLIVAGLGLLVLLLFIPSKERTITDLDLSSTDQAKLDDPNFIVAELEPRR